MSTTIVTTSNPRPIKVIGFLLCLFACFLMIVAITASDWISSDEGGWREGLLDRCAKDGTPTPLPFGMEAVPGCIKGRFTGYIITCLILSVICLVCNTIGMVLMGCGLKSDHPRKKYRNYKVATVFIAIAFVTIVAVVALYPLMFQKDLEKEGNNPALDGSAVTSANIASLVSENKKEIPENDSDEDGSSLDESNRASLESNGEIAVQDQDDQLLESDVVEEVVEEEEEGSGGGETFRVKRQDDALQEPDSNENIRNWEDFTLGFGYGCAVVSAIFIFIALVVIVFDQKKEEIYYKEVSVHLSEVQE